MVVPGKQWKEAGLTTETGIVTDSAPEPPSDREWVRCSACEAIIFGPRFARLLRVCPSCGFHDRLTAPERIGWLLDPGSVTPLESTPVPEDPLGFVDTLPYGERLRAARADTGLDAAVLCVRGAIGGHPVNAAVMDFRFMGGSLDVAVGERIARTAEESLRTRTPFLVVTASGGARMQEGTFALVQMAKTAQALAALDAAGVLTVTLVTDPTYGGVAASFATLTDVIVVEPRARMGFAGPRVIEQTIRRALPEGFQSAEFLLRHGLIDDVRPRGELRSWFTDLLAGAVGTTKRGRPEAGTAGTEPAVVADARALPIPDPWKAVETARQLGRPTTLDYASYLLDSFRELHGDRMSDECPAIVGGLGRLDDRPVLLIGHQKGHDTEQLIARNFGMPMPAGYRKAARLMRLAAKLGHPVVALIDTPGAFPGVEAEENGQAVAIAENLRLMAGLPVPIVSVITGEGGSGGALALGVADRLLALSNATYSVISPEGCAAILWRDSARAPEAAQALRLTATEQLRFGVIDGVVEEPEGGAHTDPAGAAGRLHAALCGVLDDLCALERARLLTERHDRIRRAGVTA